MDAVIRATAIFVIIMVLFRIGGKRSLSQVTTFDFVLLLVVGESTQQALLGDDFSVATAAITIATLLTLDRAADLLGYRFPSIGRIFESTPLILVDDGNLLHDRMKRVQVTDHDILAAARELHGLESLDQVKFAVLEQSGGISIVPR